MPIHHRIPRRLALSAGSCAVLALGLPGCAQRAQRAVESGLRMVTVQEWGGTAAPSGSSSHRITHVTVHHQGEIWPEDKEVGPYLRALQRWSREARGWSDIPYHYIVAPDGTVYRARPESRPGDTNTEYDPRGHVLVMLLGNFEVQSPTARQWESSVALLAHLLSVHGLSAAALGTHRDYSGQTVCPGANLSRRFDELRALVAARVRQPQ
jgi:hypothetical protein